MSRQDDHVDFVKAMDKEIAAHEKKKHWEVVPRSSVPIGTKAIQAIWAFKRTRFPCGLLNKHKARLCAHGGMQQWGVNYWETYAPVVNWISIRFLLVLSEIVGLKSKALDSFWHLHRLIWMFLSTWSSQLVWKSKVQNTRSSTFCY